MESTGLRVLGGRVGQKWAQMLAVTLYASLDSCSKQGSGAVIGEMRKETQPLTSKSQHGECVEFL